MGRKIGGVVVGLLVAFIVVLLIEAFGHSAFPPGPGFDPAAPDLELVPLNALLAVATAWLVGPLVGGFMSTRVAKSSGPVPALVVGLFFLVADVANLIMIPSPTWLWVVGLVAPLPSAWIGFALARRGAAPVA